MVGERWIKDRWNQKKKKQFIFYNITFYKRVNLKWNFSFWNVLNFFWIQYIYIPKKEIIRLSIARKEKKIGFWNNKSFIADNNNDENRSDNI